MEPDPEPPSNFGTGSTKERPAPSPNTAHLVGNIYLWFNHHPLAIRNTYYRNKKGSASSSGSSNMDRSDSTTSWEFHTPQPVKKYVFLIIKSNFV